MSHKTKPRFSPLQPSRPTPINLHCTKRLRKYNFASSGDSLFSASNTVLSLAYRSEALDAGLEYLVAGALPPILGGEDFDLLGSEKARSLDHAAEAHEVDHAVAHHAAVEQ